MTRLRRYLLFYFALTCASVSAQENIGLGEWRLHVSYNKIKSIAASATKIYAASYNGIIVFDPADKSSETLNKLNSLSTTGIDIINYHESTNTLVVGYDNGTFDIVNETEVRNFDPSSNTVLTGTKSIHDITFKDHLAYLSTDYGVLVFDLQRSGIKETWRDLGAEGNALKIFGSTFADDSIFLATENGILAGDLNDNLLDFNSWKRMTDGELNGEVDFIKTFNNKLFAAVSGYGIFSYENYAWSKEPFLDGQIFSSLSSSPDHMLITGGNNLWRVDKNDELESATDNLITEPLTAHELNSGKLWIGDASNGLVTDNYGAFESFIPNGPATDNSYDLQYFDNAVYMVGGGFSGDTPLLNDGLLSSFKNAMWSTSDEQIKDLTSTTFAPDGRMFISSFGYGVLDKNSGTLYDEANSTLINTNSPGRNVNVTALHYSDDGLWAANYGTFTSLHLLNTQDQWESYTLPYSQAKYPLKIITDFESNVWVQLNPALGGGIAVFDRENNESLLLTEIDENGELPSNAVYSLALDRDGYVWAGTNAGVAYFYDEESDAVKPIFENRFLLRDDKVTAIAVDGGNRKWMGTERGVWLFNPTGEVAILNFTESNSPLLSDKIIDIEINPVTGEVFFATDKGLVSFRSDATDGNFSFSDIKIFPNPVVNNFTGEVGISGLATDAVVKITDVSGKLIFQTVANGGTASWNVRDHQGRRVPTGVFLVFAVMSDGSESVVGKIAVVN
jgi:hypothetical protein